MKPGPLQPDRSISPAVESHKIMLSTTPSRFAAPSRRSPLPQGYAEAFADKGPKHCAYEASAGHCGRRALDRVLQQDRKR